MFSLSSNMVRYFHGVSRLDILYRLYAVLWHGFQFGNEDALAKDSIPIKAIVAYMVVFQLVVNWFSLIYISQRNQKPFGLCQWSSSSERRFLMSVYAGSSARLLTSWGSFSRS